MKSRRGRASKPDPSRPWLRYCGCVSCRYDRPLVGEACSWCGGISGLEWVESEIDGVVYRDPACNYCAAWLRRVGPDEKPTDRHLPPSEREHQGSTHTIG